MSKTAWVGLAGCALIATLMLARALLNDAGAQQKPAAAPKTAPATSAPATSAAPQPSNNVSGEQTVYLVRSTLTTLSDANRAGNYSVLRDLATPDFQASNTAADLGIAFLSLRRHNVDLFALAFTTPQFTAAPAVSPQGILRLTGFFPMQSSQLNFDLSYRVVNGQWRPHNISILIPDAPAPDAPRQPANPEPAKPASRPKADPGPPPR